MFKGFIVSVAVMLVCGSCSKKGGDAVAIMVNGHSITKPEIQQAASAIHESIVATFPAKAVEGINEDMTIGAAHQLMANAVLIDEANARGLKADSAAVDSAYSRITGQFNDKAAFERELTLMGETAESMREKIADGVRLNTLMQLLLEKVPEPDSAACYNYYNEHKTTYIGAGRNRVSQIFFPFVDSTTLLQKEQLQKKMEEIGNRIRTGESFAAMATKFSRGPGATEQGDIGWFKKGDLKPELEGPLAQLGKGEVGKPVVSDIGVHLLMKTDVEAEKQLLYAEVRDHIRYMLELKKRNSAIVNHIDSLLQKAKIKYFDPEFSAEKIQEFRAQGIAGSRME